MLPEQYSSSDAISNAIDQHLSSFKYLSLYTLKGTDKFMAEEIDAEIQGEGERATLDMLYAEYASAQLLAHSNIIRYHGLFVHAYYVYNVTQFCATPLSAVKFYNKDCGLSVSDVLKFTAQTALALAYLHSPYKVGPQHISTFCLPRVHGWMSLDSVVIDAASSRYVVMDLVPTLRRLRVKSKRTPMSRRYFSPEKLLRGDDSPGFPQDDAWSLGIILYECITNQKFNCPDKEHYATEEQWTEFMGKHIDLIQDVWLRNLVMQLLAFNPAERLTVEELLMDPRIAQAAADNEARLVSHMELSFLGDKRMQCLYPEIVQANKDLHSNLDQLLSEISGEERRSFELKEQCEDLTTQQESLLSEIAMQQAAVSSMKDLANDINPNYDQLKAELEELARYLDIDINQENTLSMLNGADQAIQDMMNAIQQLQELVSIYNDHKERIRDPNQLNREADAMLVDLKSTIYSTAQFIARLSKDACVDLLDSDIPTCSVCLGSLSNIVFYRCNHIACCNVCLEHILNSTRTCPICRTEITQYKEGTW